MDNFPFSEKGNQVIKQPHIDNEYIHLYILLIWQIQLTPYVLSVPINDPDSVRKSSLINWPLHITSNDQQFGFPITHMDSKHSQNP